MRCVNCNAENSPEARFCIECGAPQARTCARCAALNPPQARYCQECGQPLGSAPPRAAAGETARPPRAGDYPQHFRVRSQGGDGKDSTHPAIGSGEGERKTVTALFADIKGSTELMEDLDPEEVQALVDPALRLMIEAAHHFDGYIVQSTGDGIFALFGAPMAREDHPLRALHAALRMQGELRKYGAQLRADGRPPIEIRVGVNTGEVVVRSIQTGASETEYTPIGLTANLAARLQAIAPTGSIVASKNTEQLAAGYFTTRTLGPVKIRGLSDPVEVFEVLGVGPLRTRLQAAAARGLSRFVGRSREIAKLTAAFDEVRRGHGQVAAAVAEAGVGKSRLFHEFKAIVGSNAMTLEAYSVSHGRASAYLPVIDLLNGYFEIVPEDDRRRRREKVGGKILMLDRELEDTLPFLSALLGIEAAGAGGESPPVAGLDARERRRATLAAIQRILLRESRNQPLILVFEDLHWVDDASQALLDLMAAGIAPERIMMLVNYRPEYRHRWAAQPNYTELRLQPLGSAGAGEMLDALLGAGPAGSAVTSPVLAEVKRFIIAKTDGNPLFIEEMVRTLFEHGALKRNGVLEIATPLAEIRIPPTVNGILAARIDRLPGAQKELLQTLAVIGKRFGAGIIGRVVAGELAARLEPMLAALEASDFIFEEPDDGESAYCFKHALTQEVAYGSLLSERRKQLHERTAAAMEQLYGSCIDDCLAVVAYHYGRSGNLDKAVDYLNRAGLQAARRGAYGEAVERLNQAVALIPQLPATPDRHRRELSLLSSLGQYLIPSKGVAAEEVRTAFERARELAVDYGTEAELFWVAYGLLFHYLVRLDLKTARVIGERLVAIAERSGAPPQQMAAFAAMAQTLTLTGEFAAARSLCERARTLPTDQAEFPLGDIGDARVMILSTAASVLAITGFIDQALRRSDESIVAARTAGPHSLIVAMNSAAELRFRIGEWETTVVRADELEAFAVQRDMPYWISYARTLRGQALIHLGRVDEGIDLIRTGGSAFETTPAVGRQWRIHYANALILAGRADEALAMLDEIADGLAAVGWAIGAAELQRLRAEALLRRTNPGDRAAAEAALREALELAGRQQALLFELRAANSLARLLMADGRGRDARALVADIYARFTEGFDAPDLRDARDLLDRAGAAQVPA